MMRKVILIALLLAAAVTLTGHLAVAGSTSGTLAVSATVTDSCSVDTTDGASFGNYVAGQAGDLTDDITVSVNCGSTTSFTLYIGNGNSYSGTDLTRRMADILANHLNYNLYDGTCTGNEFSSVIDAATNYGVTATTVSVSGCAMLPGLQSVPTGSYADAVQVDVTW